MKNPIEITRSYQFLYMLRCELVGVVACAFVEFLLFVGSYSNDAFRIISGILFALINFFIVYNSAAKLGKSDMKTYTPLKYNVKWSVLWGIAIAVVNLLSVAVFKMNWHFFTVDGVLANPFSVVLNISFYVWQSPYMAFLIMTPNVVPIAVVVVGCVLPCIASVTGYMSGKYDFLISDKIHGLMFEKGNKDI